MAADIDASCFRRAGIRRVAALALAGGLWAAGSSAQEDDSADHGSRAAAKASGAANAPRARRQGSLEASTHAAVFGGSFVQGSQVGVLVNAGADVALIQKHHRERLEVDYQYDPFTTKTFNFADEDQSVEASRLAQGLHELDARTRWQGRWSSWLRSELALSGDTWFPDNGNDRRWSLRAEGALRLGLPRGVYADAGAAVFLKKYPRYQVADRRIDQNGAAATLELGYEWAAFSRLAIGHALELTRYSDARYDRLEPDGSVVRADLSKSYVNQISFASAAVAIVPALRLSLRYEHELNDSRNYARRIAATDELGNPLVKFLPDYYDFGRDRGTFKARFLPHEHFSLSALVEGWLRDFSTYEARDSENVWLGRLRRDTSVELGGELALGVLDVDQWGLHHGLFVTCFGSHLQRRSNMRRELSLATTFDITRLFLGLELRPR